MTDTRYEKRYSLTHIANMGFDEAIQLPMVESVSVDTQGNIQRPIGTVSMKIDEVDSSTTYVGQAQPGTATSSSLWRIKKILTSGTETSFLLADGDLSFDNVWDDRATLNYL